MKLSSEKPQQAMALMVVMIAIFVLSALAAAFAFHMKVETKLAMNAQKEGFVDSWQGAMSGVEAAKWLLAMEMSSGCRYTSLNQKWAGGSGEDCETNGPLMDVSLAPFRIGDQTYPFSLKITDMDAKINVNLLSTLRPDESVELLRRSMMMMEDFGASDIDAISSSILDWIDSNTNSMITRPNGAKSDYYQSLNPPYVAKGGPIDDLSELLLIKGIRERPEIYSEDFRMATFQQVDRHGRIVEPPTNTVYLVDIFTPLSSASVNGLKVNLNTTSAEVLQALGIDEALAVDIIARRNEAPFINIPQDAGGRYPQLKPILDRFCVVQSYTFKVEVTAEGSQRKYYAIIGCGRTANEKPQLLSFHWEDPHEVRNSTTTE